MTKTFENYSHTLPAEESHYTLSKIAGYYWQFSQLSGLSATEATAAKTQTDQWMRRLQDALIGSSLPPSLETYRLLRRYFPDQNWKNLVPKYTAPSRESLEAMQNRAARLLDHPLSALPTEMKIEVPKFNVWGRKTGCHRLNYSVYNAISGGQMTPYGLVDFGCPRKAEDIPLFIQGDQKQVYRLDVMGGSKLKPQMSQKKFGSLFAVPIESGHYLQSWLTSKESFYYAQRAFTPEEPDKVNYGLEGRFTVEVVPDGSQSIGWRPHLIVQDGCGFIKASLVKKMGLELPSTPEAPKSARLSYQALHFYKAAHYPAAVQEIKQAGQEALKTALRSSQPSAQALEDLYYALAAGLPGRLLTAIPVTGDQLVLPETKDWSAEAWSRVVIGRNPYSSPLLQAVNQVTAAEILRRASALQYTLTGYVKDSENQASGEFYKGLLVVVPDEEWTGQGDILLSAKDKKLCQRWRCPQDKSADQQPADKHLIDLCGALIVKQVLAPGELFGLPLSLATALGADFDGDQCNLVSGIQFPALHAMVADASQCRLPNPKLCKTFTERQEMGNYEKIVQIRGNLLERWTVMSNVLQTLSLPAQTVLAEKLRSDALLTEVLGKDKARWAEQLGLPPDAVLTPLIRLTAEVQMGIKCGEDLYKTRIPYAVALERLSAYEQALRAQCGQLMVPYGKGLKRRLSVAGTPEALREELHKLSRAPSQPSLKNGKTCLRGLGGNLVSAVMLLLLDEAKGELSLAEPSGRGDSDQTAPAVAQLHFSRGGSESYHPNFFQSIPPAKNTDNPPLQRVWLKP